MRAATIATILTSLVAGIHARGRKYDFNPWSTDLDFIGTFDTFTDRDCSEGGRGITVTEEKGRGELSPAVKSVKAYFKDCTCKSPPPHT